VPETTTQLAIARVSQLCCGEKWLSTIQVPEQTIEEKLQGDRGR